MKRRIINLTFFIVASALCIDVVFRDSIQGHEFSQHPILNVLPRGQVLECKPEGGQAGALGCRQHQARHAYIDSGTTMTTFCVESI